MALALYKLCRMLFILLCICASLCHGLHKCHHNEYQALLLFKAHLNDSRATLNSWLNGTDCCKWHGISCDLHTNHVLTLNITYRDRGEMSPGLDGGIISNSLCHLHSLTHLQLDGNDLTGTLPLCLGNLSHLQYLDLEGNNLGGTIRPLANLSPLRYLYLGDNNLSGTIHPLGNLSHLQYLDLGYNNFSGKIPPTICLLSNLTYLDLSNNKLNGSLPSCMGEVSSLRSLPLRVGNLSHLRYLDLDNNNLSGPHRCRHRESQALLLFKALLNDSRATLISWLEGTDCCMWHGISCDLHTNHVLTLNVTESLDGGIMSDSLCDLRSLTHVELQSNQLTGILPLCLGNLSHLQYLDLSSNYYLSGTIPPTICLLANLTYLDVSSNQINGSIPSCIGKLSSLTLLDLGNNRLSGTLPSSLGSLSSLQRLYLYSNQLKANIPETLGNLSSLFTLSISYNLLSGTLPSSIAKLSSLAGLFAYSNAFNETIPSSALPSSMQHLALSLNNNQTISETFFYNLTKLKSLVLSNCVLNISTTWIASFQLQILELVSCKINGQIPLWISTQFLLEELTLADNNLSGEIPSWLWETSSSLGLINLTANHLQGCLFTNSWMQLNTLDVSKNLLSGYLPSLWSPSVYWLHLNDNLFTGNVPSSLGTLSFLQVLNLANNHLNGIIPPNLVNCSSLEVLDLGNNSLNGQMPYEIGRLYQLQSLVVRNNKLKGLFPPSMANCTSLQFLDIGHNSFKGQIPKFIGNLSLLKVLVMESNDFSGNIPSEIGQLTELHILQLSSNSLSGFIPLNISSLQAMTTLKEDSFVLSQISVLNMFTQGILFEGLHMVTKGIDLQYPYIRSELISIDLSNNKLEGEVPSNVGKLNRLMSLNLSMNYFDGCIPNSLGKLSQLESLDLSSNRFSGKIPGELESLDYLEVLNLSNNHLSGSIPQGKKLYLLPNSSYTGNPDLWGCPLPKNCSWPQFALPSPVVVIKREKSTKIPWYEITLGLSYGVGFGVTTLLIIVRMSWKKKYFEKVDVVLKFLFPWLTKWTL